MDNNLSNEKYLVLGLLNGDESAFCALYALYKERLIFFALKFVKSHEIAEDVYQDAFISVWQNSRFLNPNVPFGPYIYTIVKNRILNLLANLDREQELKNILLSQAVNVDNETEEKMVDAELNQLLDRAIEKLTPQQKRIFNMSRREMQSHKEIADKLGISIYTVQQHISASLKVIRTYFQRHGEGYADIIFLFLLNNYYLFYCQ